MGIVFECPRCGAIDGRVAPPPDGWKRFDNAWYCHACTSERRDVFARGIVVPSLTVFKDDMTQTLDEKATAEHIEWLLGGKGIHGLVPGGSSGEFVALSDDEAKRVFDIAIEVVARRVPVYPATGRYGTRQTIELSRYASQCGADGLMVVVPYYMQPSREGVIEHFRILRNNLRYTPIILYNNPGTCGIEVTPHDLLRLYRSGTIDAVKQSQGPAGPAVDLARNEFGPEIYYGHDYDAARAIKGGVHGWLSGILNVYPSEAHSIWNGNYAPWARVSAFAQHVWIDHALHPVTAYKAMLQISGRPVGKPRWPLAPASPSEMETLERILGSVYDE